MSSSNSHTSEFAIGVHDKYITQVRRVLNEFFGESEVSDNVIGDFLLEARARYNFQTGNSVTDWSTQSYGLNYCIARTAALYVALGLSARGFSGGNMSYRLGVLEVDRKDTIDLIQFYQNMVERQAVIYGFHPMQGVTVSVLSETIQTQDDLFDEINW
jgi:hypothetical protein